MAQNTNSAVTTNFSYAFQRRGDAVSPHLSSANVSNPPTDAQLDTAFDTAANINAVVDPFVAIVDDNGAGTTVWLVVATNDAWFYELLTLAT